MCDYNRAALLARLPQEATTPQSWLQQRGAGKTRHGDHHLITTVQIMMSSCRVIACVDIKRKTLKLTRLARVQIREGRVKSISARAAGDLKKVRPLSWCHGRAQVASLSMMRYHVLQTTHAPCVSADMSGVDGMQDGWVFLDVRPPTEIAKVSCTVIVCLLDPWLTCNT